MYRRGLWSAPLMLCYLYKYMAYVTSDMIHTSGDGTLDMRTSTLEPGPLIGRPRRGLPAAKSTLYKLLSYDSVVAVLLVGLVAVRSLL